MSSGSFRKSDVATELRVLKKLPKPGPDARRTLLIYDRVLATRSKRFQRWAEAHPHRYGVRAGEDLKNLDAFPEHMKRLLELALKAERRGFRILAVGGGSVGDFAGFAASILWRGVPWEVMPSTWLAALDSAHGGKTALNVGGAKNQLGTFHLPSAVHVVDEILAWQDPARAEEAMGELVKMALIDGGPWVKTFARSRLKPAAQLARYLRPAVEAKYRVVNEDPREQSGWRRILNLGHTLGHVLEAAYGLPHGNAVAEGLHFSAEWSWSRGLLNDENFAEVMGLLQEKLGFRWVVDPAECLSRAAFLKLLAADKKRDSKENLSFVFVKGIGEVSLESVTLTELCDEAAVQGWIR